jgi:HK97 family phage major capsid protein
VNEVLNLSEKLAAKRAEGEAIIDKCKREKRSFDPSERRTLDAITVEAKELSGDMEKMLRFDGAGNAPIHAGSLDGIGRDLEPGEVRYLKPNESILGDRHVNIEAEARSLGRTLKGMITGDWKGADRERESLRDSTLAGTGQYLVSEPLSAAIIELARAQTVCIKAGAKTIEMSQPTQKIARQLADPTSHWQTAELAPITKSDPSFDAVTLTAHTLGCLVLSSIQNWEDILDPVLITESISASLALELDRAALYGTGTGVPTGLSHTTGVGVAWGGGGTTAAAALTGFGDLASGVAAIRGVNINGPLTIVTSPTGAGYLDALRNYFGDPMGMPGSLKNITVLTTTAVPTVTAGQTEYWLGDWSNMTFGVRDQLILEVSREGTDGTTSAFSSLGVWIRGYLRADVAATRPQAFLWVKGALPQVWSPPA